MDLALRPGHSGGPLVDHEGRLLGISTMMAGLEVGLAVPVHVILEFVANVLSEGFAEGPGQFEKKTRGAWSPPSLISVEAVG